MIWLNGKTWSIVTPLTLPYNTSTFCPYEGKIWATIIRPGAKFFSLNICPRLPNPAWDDPWTRPGSLLWWHWHENPSSLDETVELPRPLLWREIKLEEGLTSATLSGYNDPTLPPESFMSPNLMVEIAALRAKEAAGTLTDEELRVVLRKMREGRVTAAVTSARSRTKATAAVDADAALAKVLSL
jgi:hypothetical protein